MNKFTCLAFAAAVAAPLSAQFTSPPGYVSKDGPSLSGIGTGYSFYLGYNPNQRFQMIDGEQTGKGTKVVKSVGYRHDAGYNYSTFAGMGRKWTNVKLYVSEGVSHTKMSRTFASNITGKQSKVYDAAVSWPSQAGKPTTNPAPWSKSLQFPFSSVWVYTGKADILQDYHFAGGSLANGGAWTSRTYYLDGLHVTTALTNGRSHYGNATCNDSSVTSTRPADSPIQFAQYSKAYTGTAAWNDKALIQAWSQNVAPNSNVVQAIGIASFNGNIGVNIGAKCNNLILNTTWPHQLLFNKTNASGSVSPWNYAVLGNRATVMKFVKLLSISFWSQGAWNDSKTGAFSLTRAAKCTPTTRYTLSDVLPKMRGSYARSLTATTGGTPSFGYATPLVRYN